MNSYKNESVVMWRWQRVTVGQEC